MAILDSFGSQPPFFISKLSPMGRGFHSLVVLTGYPIVFPSTYTINIYIYIYTGIGVWLLGYPTNLMLNHHGFHKWFVGDHIFRPKHHIFLYMNAMSRQKLHSHNTLVVYRTVSAIEMSVRYKYVYNYIYIYPMTFHGVSIICNHFSRPKNLHILNIHQHIYIYIYIYIWSPPTTIVHTYIYNRIIRTIIIVIIIINNSD